MKKIAHSQTTFKFFFNKLFYKIIGQLFISSIEIVMSILGDPHHYSTTNFYQGGFFCGLLE